MPVEPTTRKGQRTRARILNAARKVFAERGYVDTRMNDVAERAGLSLGALYRYFGDKEDVFAALIGDLHVELYEASRPSRHDFAREPFLALLEANHGYLSHYFENRDLMRAFIEAANICPRFREIWWAMRRRHVERFVHVYRSRFGDRTVDGVDLEVAADAMACMVEQCAYAWFAHEALQTRSVSVDEAARVVTITWYRTFFEPSPPVGGDHDGYC